MEKEVMDALCMLHSLAKKDTTYTTQDEQFNIIKKYIKGLQKEIEREKEYTDFYKDLCKRQLEKIKELKGYTKVTGRIGGMTNE